LGEGGEGLLAWAFSDDPDDRRIPRESTVRSGTVILGGVILGRGLFDVVDGPGGWKTRSATAPVRPVSPRSSS
jgi:hypothetical protein